MAKVAQWGLEVMLVAVVASEEKCLSLCAQQSRGRNWTHGVAPKPDTAMDVALVLLRETLDTGAGAFLGALGGGQRDYCSRPIACKTSACTPSTKVRRCLSRKLFTPLCPTAARNP